MRLLSTCLRVYAATRRRHRRKDMHFSRNWMHVLHADDGRVGCPRLVRTGTDSGVAVGRSAPAGAGVAPVYAGSEANAFDPVQAGLEPVFAALGQRTAWLGPAGRGSRMKLVVNTLLAFEVEARLVTDRSGSCRGRGVR